MLSCRVSPDLPIAIQLNLHITMGFVTENNHHPNKSSANIHTMQYIVDYCVQ